MTKFPTNARSSLLRTATLYDLIHVGFIPYLTIGLYMEFVCCQCASAAMFGDFPEVTIHDSSVGLKLSLS